MQNISASQFTGEQGVRVFEFDLANGGYGSVLVSADAQVTKELYTLIKRSLGERIYSSLENIRAAVKTPGSEPAPEFSVCIFVEGKVYCMASGGASIHLFRSGNFIPIIETIRGSTSLASGFTRPNDIYLMQSSAMQRSVPDAEKRALLAKMGHRATKYFAEQLAGKDELEGAGMAAIAIGADANLEIGSKPEHVAEKAGIRTKLAGILDRALSVLPERHIVVNGEQNGTRAKKASLVGFLLLALLFGSIFFGLNKQKEQRLRDEYEPRLLQAINDFTEAVEIADLSRPRAREMLLESRRVALALSDDGVEDERLAQLLAKLPEYLADIAGIYEAKPEVFMDLTIIASGFEANHISLSGGLLRVLDAERKRLAGIEVGSKRTQIIAGPDYFPNTIRTASYTNRSFVLSSDGIREVTEDVALVVRPEWRPEAVLVSAFAGNIYILDQEGNQIWRYRGVRGGFLEKEPWLGSGFTIDLSDTISMAIDGSIWTLESSGNIKVYSLGAPAQIALHGITEPLSAPVDLFTDESTKFVYILDPGSTRVSVVAKNGQYLGEYVAEEIKGAKQVVVDEQAGLILLLVDSKILTIGIKHMSML